MRFGRVEGVVTPVEADGARLLRLIVWLDTGSRLETVRDEAAGGTAYRRACPAQRHVSRTFPIAAGRTEWPQHWLVLYEDSRAPERHGLLLRIDAASGDVLERELDAPDCPELP